MGARFRLIGTLATGLIAASEGAQAQDSDKLQALPDIEVTAPSPAGTQPARNRGAARADRVVRRVQVYPTAPTPMSPTPTGGTGGSIAVDKVPAAINAVGANQIAQTDSLNIADALQQYVPGIITSD